MANVIRDVIDRVSDALDINSATLSGAIDVVVIRQPDGSLKSTPFHVRFGKLQLLRSKEKNIMVTVNGEMAPFRMKLGSTGEAFFVEETQHEPPPNLLTSPIASPLMTPAELAIDQPETTVLDQLHEEHHQDPLVAADGVRSDGDYPVGDYSVGDEVQWSWGQLPSTSSTAERPVPRGRGGSINRSRVISDGRQIRSDDEAVDSRGVDRFDSRYQQRFLLDHFEEDVNKQDVEDDSSRKWSLFGHWRQPQNSTASPHAEPSAAEGAPSLNEAETPVAVSEDGAGQSAVEGGQIQRVTTRKKRGSKRRPVSNREGTDPAQSGFEDVELSLCADDLSEALINSQSEECQALFDARLIAYEDFADRAPEVMFDERLMVRLNHHHIMTWKAACPLLIAGMVYGRSLPNDVMDKCINADTSHRRSWGWFRGWSEPPQGPEAEDGDAEDEEMEDSDGSVYSDQLDDYESSNVYTRKTVRPSSEMLKELPLRQGENTVTFEVTSRLQGKQTVMSRIFLWEHSDKIVISDVDGTITRSDVLGHVLPALGKDWSHSGVAALFTKVKQNGYHIVYLTSRSIGQASVTRAYLQSVQQGETSLPDGPTLMSPDSLLFAFTREVILRRPEEFKIACLTDLRAQFPPSLEPFYAGFGNRHTDVISYTRAGVPQSRVFIINPSGDIHHSNVTYKKSYEKLHQLADAMFPPSLATRRSEDELFNDYNFWRSSLPVLSDEEDLSEPDETPPPVASEVHEEAEGGEGERVGA